MYIRQRTERKDIDHPGPADSGLAEDVHGSLGDINKGIFVAKGWIVSIRYFKNYSSGRPVNSLLIEGKEPESTVFEFWWRDLDNQLTFAYAQVLCRAPQVYVEETVVIPSPPLKRIAREQLVFRRNVDIHAYELVEAGQIPGEALIHPSRSFGRQERVC